MRVHPSTTSVAIAIAVAVGVVEGLVASQAKMGPVIALPLAFGTAGSVIWTALAYDAMRRGRARPGRDELIAVGHTQAAHDLSLKTQAERVARTEQTLTLLAADSVLAKAETAITATAERIERWDAVAATLPQWLEARGRWARIVGRLAPVIVADLDKCDDDEIRAAHDRLPTERRFSAQDQQAAATYLALSDRLEAARERWAAHRQSATENLFEAPRADERYSA